MQFHHWAEASAAVVGITGAEIARMYGIEQANTLRAAGVDVPFGKAFDYFLANKNYLDDWGPTEYGALAATFQTGFAVTLVMSILSFVLITATTPKEKTH